MGQIFFTTSGDTKGKERKKGCANLTKEFFFWKKAQNCCYVQGPKKKKKLEIEFQLFLGKFSPLPVDTKRREKNGCANLTKEPFFWKKAQNCCYILRAKEKNNLEIKFQLFLGKFSPLRIDTKGGEKMAVQILQRIFFEKRPKVAIFRGPKKIFKKSRN